MKNTSDQGQSILLRRILEEIKELRKSEKNNNRHLGRHSNMINYAQTMLKTLWDERLLREQQEKNNKDKELDESKIKVKKLTKLLITISAIVVLTAIGINNVPEAVFKLVNLL